MQTNARRASCLAGSWRSHPGWHESRILHRSQRLSVTLAIDDGAQYLLARFTHHVGDDVGELDVHLRERLLHVLHVPALGFQEHPALAPQRTQRAHRIGRTKRPLKQAVGHELLQPLAVQHVGLAARDVLDVARVDQQHGEAARLQQFKQRNPVHARGFHGDRVDAASHEPVGQGIEVDREAGKLTYRFIVPVGRHGDIVGGAADVDAGGVGVGDRQGGSGLARFGGDTTIALGHGLLHHSVWNVALHRVRRLAHSLKRDIGPAAENRRADSPMSMTSPRTTLTRGQYAPLLHRSSAAPHSTLPQRSHPVFLRRDLRHGPITSLTLRSSGTGSQETPSQETPSK